MGSARSVGFLLLGYLASGCGGGGGTVAPAPVPMGSRVLRLAGGPGDGLTSLRVQVTKVEVEGASGWIDFAAATQSTDLVDLAGGGTEALVTTTGPLLQGAYSRVRVSFAPAATASLGTGNSVAVGCPASVIVEAPGVFSGAQQSLVLVLDPGRSLQQREGAFLLRPELQVREAGSLGQVQGRLTANGQGLAGVVVTAQTFREFGVPTVLRRVVTGSDGAYTLDLLPTGTPLHVVAQPVTAVASYDPQASPALTLGAAPGAWNAAFTHRASLASFRGEYRASAASDQSGEVHLLGPVQAGTEVKLFSLRHVPTFLSAGVETHRMLAIPTGSYVLRGFRSTWRSDGTVTRQGQNSTDLGLISDFETTVDFLW